MLGTAISGGSGLLCSGQHGRVLLVLRSLLGTGRFSWFGNPLPTPLLQIAEEHARLLTGSWDGWCCMWDLNTQALVDRYPGDSAVLCACLKPEEREIWALNREGVLLRWDTREPPAAPQTWDVPHCSRFAFADTSLCVCGFGGGGGVCVYDMRRFSPEKEPLVAFPSPEGGQGKDVISLAVCSPAPTYGPALLAAGYFSGHVALWAFK